MSYRGRKTTARILVLACLVFSTTISEGADGSSTRPQTDPAAMTMDLVLARPGGLLATIAGAAIFVVSAPFSALGGNTGEAWNSLVVTPAAYTFKRPLGEFDYEPPVKKEEPSTLMH